MIYYTSDLHLGHANIIRLCNRPFSDVDEMNAELIANWNAKVTNGDTVYICGDLMFRSATDPELFLTQLKGKKHLIVGNHDGAWMKKVELPKYFKSVEKLKDFSNGKCKITLCHYPMMSFEGKYLIHGHIHNNKNDTYWKLLREMENALNASVEINGYAPASFDELIANNQAVKDEDKALEKAVNAFAPVIGHLKSMARSTLIQYRPIADDIIAGRIVGENSIGWQLDHLLDYCSDDEVHALYEEILQGIEPSYQQLVKDYREIYENVWGEGDIDDAGLWGGEN
jgi:calcineurin-like phosphoesterase family protein